MRRIKMGVRYELVRTERHQWGPGKTHLLVYDRLNKMWVHSCSTRGYHANEQDDLPTKAECCKRCARMIEQVFGLAADLP